MFAGTWKPIGTREPINDSIFPSSSRAVCLYAVRQAESNWKASGNNAKRSTGRDSLARIQKLSQKVLYEQTGGKKIWKSITTTIIINFNRRNGTWIDRRTDTVTNTVCAPRVDKWRLMSKGKPKPKPNVNEEKKNKASELANEMSSTLPKQKKQKKENTKREEIAEPEACTVRLHTEHESSISVISAALANAQNPFAHHP
ncbi:hypothetical protein BDN70DRAFT_890849 [Pholiota conissans]|uniref:Uncharacterized protein n=1 Tax=Pholiota conissans TaxID=109636 RepID=A0A9P5ZBT9_9AGAR|nr:hypothetical protein BDN70DRAFT_890849 [Pholiota conissans]